LATGACGPSRRARAAAVSGSRKTGAKTPSRRCQGTEVPLVSTTIGACGWAAAVRSSHSQAAVRRWAGARSRPSTASSARPSCSWRAAHPAGSCAV